MRLVLAFAAAAFVSIGHAETLPSLYDKPPPEVTFTPNADWRLSAVAHYEVAGARTTLIIEGDIISDAKDERATPKIRVTLRDAGGKDLSSLAVAPAESRLKPREYAAFEARIENPPAGTVSVELGVADAH